MIEFLNAWQSLIGSALGAAAPFGLWFLTEQYQKSKKLKKELYYLERVLVDQLNAVIDMRETISQFVDDRLETLVEHIMRNPAESYSIEWAFFPLFAARQLPEDIHKIPTGSSYIDNKIALAFKLSKDVPMIVDDVRRQFEHALDINKELATTKLLDPVSQKASYIQNIEEYRAVVRSQMLATNIPTYIRTLVSAHVALHEIRNIGRIRWNFRFNPRYKLFLTKKEFEKSLQLVQPSIDLYFESENRAKVDEIQNMIKGLEQSRLR